METGAVCRKAANGKIDMPKSVWQILEVAFLNKILA
jgi:hypothetical protein